MMSSQIECVGTGNESGFFLSERISQNFNIKKISTDINCLY